MNALRPPTKTVGQSLAHDSAIGHVCGSANYIDDIQPPEGCLHLAFALSPQACGKINAIDITAALSAPGVVKILLAKDIEHLLIGPVEHDEPLLAQDEVLFQGQAICAVLADSLIHARRAAALVQADISAQEPIITVEQALEKQSFLMDPITMKVGDAEQAIKGATHQLSGQFYVGGQEHFYLESQATLAIPSEKNEVVVHCSTQNPSEVQHLVAHVLAVPQHSVEVITRRMGGGFGGKETDGAQMACLAALLAKQTGRAVKVRLPRSEDFQMTGKRHDFLMQYQVGFDDAGKLQGVKIEASARCGYSLDLSYAIVSRTLFHSDNGYYLPNASFTGHLCKTNTVSNTAFRGFGGPQGMLAIESIIEDIAQYLHKDALDVRQLNFYAQAPANVTHYGQEIEDNILQAICDDLIDSSQYRQRREQVEAFNKQNTFVQKGLAFSPVKFGISFTTTFLNQAGALVHVYKDGSIYLNHGGTEMGQGLFIKVAQVVAESLGVDVERVKSSATSTQKVPNTSATAASSGSDINGMAAQVASFRIKASLTTFASQHFTVPESEIDFSDDVVTIGDQTMPFSDFINLAYLNRVELFSNGFYKTPKIHYDPKTAKGRPFYYYAYGACVSEVVMDTLTGEYKVIAADILHDVGASINPAIDLGQIVGGFIQGMGWLCMEELKWNDAGALLTRGPSTYKIPSIGDLPKRFNVKIKPDTSNHEATIFKSKAVGEPPFMLSISVWLAIKNAIHNATDKQAVQLSAPATFEQVYASLNKENAQ